MTAATHSREGGAIGARLSAMMFLEFFVWGGWYVTIGNFLKAHGMEGNTWWAYSVCPIAAIISPFFLGMVADRFFSTEKVLGVLSVIGGIFLLALPSVSGLSFNAVLLLHALCFMPTLSLTSSLAFHHMTNQEKQFPLIRVFGTIGWIVAGLVVSLWLHGDTKALQFYVAGIASVLLGFYSFSLPHTPPPAAGKQTTVHDILGLDSLKLMRGRSFATFMIASFLICIPLAFYYSWAPVYVGEIGIPDPASRMSLGQASEFFFMLAMPIFFARLGVKWMLALGMAAWVARYGLFSAAAGSGVLWMVIVGILLHGICYDFFFVTGQIYVDKKSGAAIRGQAQGFFVLVTQGVGMLVGAVVAQDLVNTYAVGKGHDWHQIWLIPCIAAAVIMVLFALLFKDDSRASEAEMADIPVTGAPVDPLPTPEGA